MASSHGTKEPLVAIIGYPVFRRLAIQINYRQHKVTFYDGPTFRHQGHGAEVPMHISNDWLVADGTVQGVPGMFSLDTGQENVALNLFNSFIQRTAIDKKLGKSFCGVAGEGFGGAQHACFTRSKLALGSVTTANLVTILSRDTRAISSTTTIAGNIGTGFFRKFTATFDAIHQKLFLEKNENYTKPDVYNRAGMVLQLVPGGEKVLNVFSGGPPQRLELSVATCLLQSKATSLLSQRLRSGKTCFGSPWEPWFMLLCSVVIHQGS